MVNRIRMLVIGIPCFVYIASPRLHHFLLLLFDSFLIVGHFLLCFYYITSSTDIVAYHRWHSVFVNSVCMQYAWTRTQRQNGRLDFCRTLWAASLSIRRAPRGVDARVLVCFFDSMLSPSFPDSDVRLQDSLVSYRGWSMNWKQTIGCWQSSNHLAILIILSSPSFPRSLLRIEAYFLLLSFLNL